MNIHEYQAKELLKSFGAPVSAGIAVLDASEAEVEADLSLPVAMQFAQTCFGH